MGTFHRSTRALMAAAALVTAGLSASCSDPVRDDAIARLGPEPAGIPPGPEHRPGQPCVLCHSEGGPADKSPFAVAGTIFDTSAPTSNGAVDVQVFFIDAANDKRSYVTNGVGNFFVRQDEWPDLTFPFKVGVLRGIASLSMQSTVNREGDCNYCHKPNPGNRYALPGQDQRESVGQIFAPGAPPGGTR